MSTLNLDSNQARYIIRGYQPGQIRVNEVTYHRSIIVTATELIDPWAPQVSADISVDHLIPILMLNPDIVLIGTGEKQEFLAAELYGELVNQGIGVEMMTTAAACRTYNALTAEDRNVAAALIIR